MEAESDIMHVVQRRHRRKNSEWRDYMYFSDECRAITQYQDMLQRPIHHNLQDYPELRVILREYKQITLVSNDKK